MPQSICFFRLSQRVVLRLMAPCLLLYVLGSGGCTFTNLPAGGDYKSAISQNSLRLAINEAFREIECSELQGKTVSFTTIGFDEDQSDVREFLRYTTRMVLTNHGVQVVSKDADITLDLVVQTCGIDASATFILPIWRSEDVTAMVDINMIARSQDGTLVSKSSLKGVAMYQEAVWLLIIASPGVYQVDRNGTWLRTSGALADWKQVFDVPISLNTVKE